MSERLEDDLATALRVQIEAVDHRVGNSGTYLQEAAEVRRAAEQVPLLRQRLGLGRYLGSLTPPTGKPQFLLLFGLPNEQRQVVLKVYGRKRPGEGAIQRLWSDRGVRCVSLLDNGDEPTSWILMAAVQGRDLLGERLAGGRLIGLTTELARTLRDAHATPVVSLPGSKPLHLGVGPHLIRVVAALERHGYTAPSGWAEWAPEVYRGGQSAFLHGDLFPGNIIRDAVDGGLRVVDCCGYVGDPAFDFARWAVRTFRPAQFGAALTAWMQGEPDMDPAVGRAMLGVEALMQAGVRELVKEERALSWDTRDSRTRALLEYSARSREQIPGRGLP